MFPVKYKIDLRNAYEYLAFGKEMGQPLDKLAEIKREIRNYSHRIVTERLVKDDGIDGYVLLIELPVFLKSQTDAEEYFGNHYFLTALPSMYDCTGQAFTSGYKVFERSNNFYAYHSVSFDV